MASGSPSMLSTPPRGPNGSVFEAIDAIRSVHDFWNSASCGEDLYLRSRDQAGYLAQSHRRYQLEPFIPAFANATETRDRDVLEIGVGLGADHQLFAEAGSRLTGIDLTERAIDHVRRRFEALGSSPTSAWPMPSGCRFPTGPSTSCTLGRAASHSRHLEGGARGCARAPTRRQGESDAVSQAVDRRLHTLAAPWRFGR